MMQILQSEQNLQHPTRYDLFLDFSLESDLSFEVVFQISFFAILFDHIGPRFFPYNLMQRDDIGVTERSH